MDKLISQVRSNKIAHRAMTVLLTNGYESNARARQRLILYRQMGNGRVGLRGALVPRPDLTERSPIASVSGQHSELKELKNDVFLAPRERRIDHSILAGVVFSKLRKIAMLDAEGKTADNDEKFNKKDAFQRHDSCNSRRVKSKPKKQIFYIN